MKCCPMTLYMIVRAPCVCRCDPMRLQDGTMSMSAMCACTCPPAARERERENAREISSLSLLSSDVLLHADRCGQGVRLWSLGLATLERGVAVAYGTVSARRRPMAYEAGPFS